MKKTLILGLVSLLLLPLLMLGCKPRVILIPPPETTMPSINGGQEAKIIDISLDTFTAENNIVTNTELIRPGSLIVRLGSNPTTGYEWGEAVISTPAVVAQASREFVGPEDTGMVGAGGTNVWVFDSKAASTATIKMSYGRPWEGGEKDTFTLTINVTVK